jgi:hypothetical protein
MCQVSYFLHRHVEYRNAQCHYAECRGAIVLGLPSKLGTRENTFSGQICRRVRPKRRRRRSKV